MHVLFVHPNYPAQFRCIAPALARDGWTCTFATRNGAAPDVPGVRRVLYQPRGGATASTPPATRTFQNAYGHAHGVYDALKARPDVKPDLVVAHSGFGSSLFLPYLYDAPVVNFFEWYYRPVGQDLGYRPEMPLSETALLRNRCRNAMILLDLDNCDHGWSPSHYQRGVFPPQFHGKIEVIPEGVDTALYRRGDVKLAAKGPRALPPDMKIVTYVSRGFELMRGFDLFMRAAQIIARRCPNVIFIVVGSDRVCYGSDKELIRERSFREHVIRSQRCDLSRFAFPGTLPEWELAQVLSASDLHVYLTVPFVPSWSLLDAMSCSCVVLASDQACTREYITHGRNGLLCDFFDAEGIAEQAVKVLKNPPDYRPLGDAARRTIEEKYSLDVCLPRIRTFFEEVAARGPRTPSVRAELLVRPGTLSAKKRQGDAAEKRQGDTETGGQGEGTPGLTPGLLTSVAPGVYAGAAARGRVVVMVWELGRGLGHVVPMLALARELVRRGHRVIVVLRDGSRAAEVFGGVGVEIVQAPFKHGGPPCFRRTASFAHILANTGWGGEGELASLASMWRRLLRRERPDAVLFEHSPTALLAARCLPPGVAKVVTGLGFFCPPDVTPLPVLVDGPVDPERLAADERRVLERANRVLARWKRPPLERLGQLFGEADDRFLETFQELDHYGQSRPAGTVYWGPVHAPGGVAPAWPAGQGKRAFAYLKNAPLVGEVLAALAELGGPTIVLADGIDPAVHRRFEAVPTMRFETRRLDMARVRAECDLAVHNANHGTLCQLLLGAKPMLQLPLQLEQQILARRVEQLGAAETVTTRGDGAGEELRRKLNAVATDPRYATAARRFALKYSSFDPSTQVQRMVERVEELIEEKGRQGDRETRGRGDGTRAKVFAG